MCRLARGVYRVQRGLFTAFHTLRLQTPESPSAPSTLPPQANWLKLKGIKKGDTVAIYMPMVMELPIAMLACARIGAVHSVVFGGFSAESLAGGSLHQRSVISRGQRGEGPMLPDSPPPPPIIPLSPPSACRPHPGRRLSRAADVQRSHARDESHRAQVDR